jgi:hypothetical protein
MEFRFILKLYNIILQNIQQQAGCESGLLGIIRNDNLFIAAEIGKLSTAEC